jgi:hypothetical protein
MAKAIKQKETFKVWKGLPKEVTITETTWNLFWRANHGNKRAVEQIVKRGLFDTWLQWNHELRTHMDVVVFLAECGLKPSSPDF